MFLFFKILIWYIICTQVKAIRTVSWQWGLSATPPARSTTLWTQSGTSTASFSLKTSTRTSCVSPCLRKTSSHQTVSWWVRHIHTTPRRSHKQNGLFGLFCTEWRELLVPYQVLMPSSDLFFLTDFSEVRNVYFSRIAYGCPFLSVLYLLHNVLGLSVCTPYVHDITRTHFWKVGRSTLIMAKLYDVDLYHSVEHVCGESMFLNWQLLCISINIWSIVVHHISGDCRRLSCMI